MSLAVEAGPGRRWSLRREWSRAFAVMLALLLAAAVATIVGVRAVVDDVGGTARQLDVESVTVAALRSDLIDHEQIAHSLLSDKPVDRPAFLRQQQEISDRFTAAAKVFPAGGALRATVVKAGRSWRIGLMTYGLWGAQVQSLHGSHSADNPTFGAASDATGALLDGLEAPALAAMNRGLSRGNDLERLLTVLLATLFGLALAVTAYFRRRMASDLVRPMATMHQGVRRLEAGDFDHRIEVVRLDELGELATAFNAMAAALHTSHRDLTVRASHDSLTGLLNRASLTEGLAASFPPGGDRRGRQPSVLFIDVDDFKNVNDTLGHEGGDVLLIQMAGRLSECVRPQDLLARLGGDEFAVVVLEDEAGSAAVGIAERICAALRPPFIVTGTAIVVAVSIGVAQGGPATGDATELLRNADFAMYTAKGGGKGRFELFDSGVDERSANRSILKSEVANAVTGGQLRLDYQPIVDLRTAEILGVEALVRWQHPTLGLLLPDDFIAVAEETGHIDAIGCWVLEQAARQVATWRATMTHCSDLWVSVNLSPLQLCRPDNLTALHAILSDPAIQADHVVLEVTETALATDVDGGIEALTTLKSTGVQIAIDDFGTGFSSLHSLAAMPVDLLKIDRAFISGHGSAAPSVPLLEGILGLAGKLSLRVIAEGIEEEGQLELLRSLDCRLGQGFLLGRPGSALEMEAVLAADGLLAATAMADGG